jgi:hypothetical protein
VDIPTTEASELKETKSVAPIRYFIYSIICVIRKKCNQNEIPGPRSSAKRSLSRGIH